MPTVTYDIFFDALLACARNLEALHSGEASGAGTTTTLVDNQLPVLGYDADDIFKGGTIFFTADASGITPPTIEDRSRYVTGYAFSTGTITFAPALPVGTEASDRYSVMTGRYPMWVMTDKIEKVMREQDILGYVTIVANGGREYAMPDSVVPTLNRTGRIHSVKIGSASASVQNWRQALVWQYDQINQRLLFKDSISNGDTIYVYFWTREFGRPSDFTAIDGNFDQINSDWVGLSAAIECVRWHLSQPGADERSSTALLNDLMVRQGSLRKTHYGWRKDFAANILGTFWPSG